MVPAVHTHSLAARAAAMMLLVSVLAGCGSSGAPSASASVAGAETPETATDCPRTVLQTVAHVLMRVYREGVASERTAAAKHLIQTSPVLRSAVEGNDPAAVLAAAQTLLATGHLTDLRVMRKGHVLATAGKAAVAPLTGRLKDANGTPIGSYATSVWSDAGFLDEAKGVTEGLVALRRNGHSLGGSLALPQGTLPDEGTLTYRGAPYAYTSFPADAYPSGSIRVYVLRSVASTTALCGATQQDTVVNTLERVANLIYAGETGKRRLEQVRRMQSDVPLLEAVARRDPLATRQAILAVLNQHVVRMRVKAAGRLLADVGGPYVLAPTTAPLRLGGRTIGTVELSIQDDEGFLRLARRLAGLDVLMYMNPTHPQLVKNSLGPQPGTVPASGSYSYRGRNFRVFTVNAQAFPSGPLTIRVLVPNPYF
jgi:hypothetical protein